MVCWMNRGHGEEAVSARRARIKRVAAVFHFEKVVNQCYNLAVAVNIRIVSFGCRLFD